MKIKLTRQINTLNYTNNFFLHREKYLMKYQKISEKKSRISKRIEETEKMK